MKSKRKLEAIDLFCGIGGLSLGLKKANINVLAGIDSDKTCAFAYEKNIKSTFINADVSKYDFNKLKYLYSENSYKILVGCAPCQPFSTHTNKNKDKNKDKRWNLIKYFIEAINVVNPEIISMENVRGFTRTEVFKNFVSEIIKMGYKVDFDVVYCPDYGIPQSRSRLVLLGSKLGKIEIPAKTHSKNKYVNIKDTIGNLPILKCGETDKSDSMHKAKNLSELNIKRIKQSKPKGTWKDWDFNLLPECYKRESGSTYTAVYGRMDWMDVSPTITTQFFNYGSGRFGHPEQDRALSFREGALLQTFPKDFTFGELKSQATIGRHIGNAVPPKLGYHIGIAIQKHLNNYEG